MHTCGPNLTSKSPNFQFPLEWSGAFMNTHVRELQGARQASNASTHHWLYAWIICSLTEPMWISQDLDMCKFYFWQQLRSCREVALCILHAISLPGVGLCIWIHQVHQGRRCSPCIYMSFLLLLLLFNCSVMSHSFETPWMVALQAPLSKGFPRQEYWSGLSFHSPGYLPDPRIEPASPVLQADSLPLS